MNACKNQGVMHVRPCVLAVNDRYLRLRLPGDGRFSVLVDEGVALHPPAGVAVDACLVHEQVPATAVK